MADVLLRFIHISDTHYAPPDYQRPPSRYEPRHGVRALVRTLNELPVQPDFILHTGDVAYDPYPEIYDEILEVFGAIKAPIFFTPGNHDHSATLQTILQKRETVEVPLYYETEHNGVRLLWLDSNGFDVELPRGRVMPEQITWLKERMQLDDPRPILVFIHHPLIKTHYSEWYDNYMRTVNGDEVHDVLKTGVPRLRGVFYGHVHQHMTFHRDGVMYSAVKSSWTQFNTWPGQGMETLNALEADPGFALVTVSTESTVVQHITYRVNVPE